MTAAVTAPAIVSSWWVPAATVAAGLLALAGVATTLLVTGRREKKAAAKKARSEAYADLLGQTWGLVTVAAYAAAIVQTRSGLFDRIDTLLGLRAPVNEHQVLQTMTGELNRVMKAWSAVLALGSQRASDAGSRLVTAVNDVIALATKPSEIRSVKIYLMGEEWTPQQRVRYELAVKRFAAAWYVLAKLVRKELKRDPTLFPLEESLGGTPPRSRWQRTKDRILRRHVRDVEVDLLPFSIVDLSDEPARWIGPACGPGTTPVPLLGSWLPLPAPPAATLESTPARLPRTPAQPARRRRR